MVGMCAGMIYNLHRKLTVDKEDIAASRKSLASLADSRDSLGPATPPSPPKSRASGRITQEVSGLMASPPSLIIIKCYLLSGFEWLLCPWATWRRLPLQLQELVTINKCDTIDCDQQPAVNTRGSDGGEHINTTL